MTGTQICCRKWMDGLRKQGSRCKTTLISSSSAADIPAPFSSHISSWDGGRLLRRPFLHHVKYQMFFSLFFAAVEQSHVFKRLICPPV